MEPVDPATKQVDQTGSAETSDTLWTTPLADDVTFGPARARKCTAKADRVVVEPALVATSLNRGVRPISKPSTI